MNRKALTISVLLGLAPSAAMANPSPLAGEYGPFIGLFVEAILVAAVLWKKGYDPIRIFYSWGVITTTTFILLVGLVSASVKAIHDNTIEFTFGILMIGEVLVVLIEAYVLCRITELSFYNSKRIAPLTAKQGLILAGIVNIISCLLGIL